MNRGTMYLPGKNDAMIKLSSICYVHLFDARTYISLNLLLPKHTFIQYPLWALRKQNDFKRASLSLRSYAVYCRCVMCCSFKYAEKQKQGKESSLAHYQMKHQSCPFHLKHKHAISLYEKMSTNSIHLPCTPVWGTAFEALAATAEHCAKAFRPHCFRTIDNIKVRLNSAKLKLQNAGGKLKEKNYCQHRCYYGKVTRLLYIPFPPGAVKAAMVAQW